MRLFIFFIVLLLFNSCSSDNRPLESLEFSAEVLPQKWELFRMSGSLAGSETAGSEMQWQESYQLRGDNSFTKMRKEAGQTRKGEGTFEFFQESDGAEGVLFTYDQDLEIIGNCTGTLTEYLYLRDGEQTLQSSWWACDGPGLFYQRVQ